MDLLSRLLSLTPVSGHIDVRCHFGAPWRLEEAAAGPNEIAYHVLLSGSAVVEDAHFAPARLGPGDILLFPRGSAHRLHDGSGRKPRPVQRQQSDSLTIAVNGGQGDPADVLCGRFVLGAGADRLLRDYLPQRLVVRSAAPTGEGADAENAEKAPTRLARLIELMREETLEEGPGSESLVSHLSAALFALTLRFASHGAEPPHGLLALAQRTRLQPAVEKVGRDLAKDCPGLRRAMGERTRGDRGAGEKAADCRVHVAARVAIEAA